MGGGSQGAAQGQEPWLCPQGSAQWLKASSALTPGSRTPIFGLWLTVRNSEVFPWACCFQTSHARAGPCPESHQDTLEFLGLFVLFLVPSRSGSGLKLLIHRVPTVPGISEPPRITNTPKKAALSSSRASKRLPKTKARLAEHLQLALQDTPWG